MTMTAQRVLPTITCYRCKHCNGVLSIAEFLERHCTACGSCGWTAFSDLLFRKDTDVVASREKQA